MDDIIDNDSGNPEHRGTAQLATALSKGEKGIVLRNRVRENQRRSRGRRREYILEIERRLRQYHEEGVVASEKVQKEARLVVEENFGLRRLLQNVGIPEPLLGQYVMTGDLDCLGDDEPSDGVRDGAEEQRTAAESLMQMLSLPMPVRLDTNALTLEPGHGGDVGERAADAAALPSSSEEGGCSPRSRSDARSSPAGDGMTAALQVGGGTDWSCAGALPPGWPSHEEADPSQPNAYRCIALNLEVYEANRSLPLLWAGTNCPHDLIIPAYDHAEVQPHPHPAGPPATYSTSGTTSAGPACAVVRSPDGLDGAVYQVGDLPTGESMVGWDASGAATGWL